ncbi:hypothetical protein [Pseudodesulfovibrio sp.]|uniref:hypothetical protein n=1 Tax=Pseudodesulfovibrio sp. TaxID=2035812 RepID=UPI0026259F83|nr:hypothetical protein [Pseudodesulfovibrio sp.]MDD3313439.1 hypothetical protein [Pseudodesulfovibrio sp.]
MEKMPHRRWIVCANEVCREITVSRRCLPALLHYMSCLLLMICIFASCGPADASGDFKKISRNELEKITTYYDDDLNDIAQLYINKRPDIYVLDYDIDSDGKDERIITIGHSAYCGTGGCCVDIFKKTPQGWELLDLGFPSLHRLPQKTGTSTNGMPDYVFDDNLWKFDGEKYQWNRKVKMGEFGIASPGKPLPQLRGQIK